MINWNSPTCNLNAFLRVASGVLLAPLSGSRSCARPSSGPWTTPLCSPAATLNHPLLHPQSRFGSSAHAQFSNGAATALSPNDRDENDNYRGGPIPAPLAPKPTRPIMPTGFGVRLSSAALDFAAFAVAASRC